MASCTAIEIAITDTVVIGNWLWKTVVTCNPNLPGPKSGGKGVFKRFEERERRRPLFSLVEDATTKWSDAAIHSEAFEMTLLGHWPARLLARLSNLHRFIRVNSLLFLLIAQQDVHSNTSLYPNQSFLARRSIVNDPSRSFEWPRSQNYNRSTQVFDSHVTGRKFVGNVHIEERSVLAFWVHVDWVWIFFSRTFQRNLHPAFLVSA